MIDAMYVTKVDAIPQSDHAMFPPGDVRWTRASDGQIAVKCICGKWMNLTGDWHVNSDGVLSPEFRHLYVNVGGDHVGPGCGFRATLRLVGLSSDASTPHSEET